MKWTTEQLEEVCKAYLKDKESRKDLTSLSKKQLIERVIQLEKELKAQKPNYTSIFGESRPQQINPYKIPGNDPSIWCKYDALGQQLRPQGVMMRVSSGDGSNAREVQF